MAADLVPGQVDVETRRGSIDIFVFDRETGAIEMVTRAAGTVATAGPGGSAVPVISADGRRVAFLSNRLDLAPACTAPRPRSISSSTTGRPGRPPWSATPSRTRSGWAPAAPSGPFSPRTAPSPLSPAGLGAGPQRPERLSGRLRRRHPPGDSMNRTWTAAFLLALAAAVPAGATELVSRADGTRTRTGDAPSSRQAGLPHQGRRSEMCSDMLRLRRASTAFRKASSNRTPFARRFHL